MMMLLKWNRVDLFKYKFHGIKVLNIKFFNKYHADEVKGQKNHEIDQGNVSETRRAMTECAWIILSAQDR